MRFRDFLVAQLLMALIAGACCLALMGLSLLIFGGQSMEAKTFNPFALVLPIVGFYGGIFAWAAAMYGLGWDFEKLALFTGRSRIRWLGGPWIVRKVGEMMGRTPGSVVPVRRVQDEGDAF